MAKKKKQPKRTKDGFMSQKAAEAIFNRSMRKRTITKADTLREY